MEQELALQSRIYQSKLQSFRGLLSVNALEEARASQRWFAPAAAQSISPEDLEMSKLLLRCNQDAAERCSQLLHPREVPQVGFSPLVVPRSSSLRRESPVCIVFC